jgi:predicted MFS family arabinose efflux permease
LSDVADRAPVLQSPKPPELTKPLIFLFAFGCGATTANVYYSQSIAGPIAADLHVSAALAGLIVTATQLGYGLGLFFLVSLSDLFDKRRLVLITTSGTIVALIWSAISASVSSFLPASILLGVCTVGSQILLPLAVHLTPENRRGRVIGSLMGGLVTGIMLSRPLASYATAFWGWRAIFVISAVVMTGLLALLALYLPAWKPRPGLGYLATLRSTASLLATSRPLQRRVAYQGTLFAVFNLFWTGVPLMLHDRFGLGSAGIGAFAMVGAAGALTAPIAGRAADHGRSRSGTGLVIFCSAMALLVSGWGLTIGSISLIVAAALVLDGSVQANQVFGQRIVQSINASLRGRLNAAYMTVIFICGACGSSLGSLTYYHGGWWLSAAIGASLSLVAFAGFLTEFRGTAARAPDPQQERDDCSRQAAE